MLDGERIDIKLPRVEFEWPPEAVGVLRDGWQRGDSARIIAERIGCTKNAVVGKAKRLKLTPRPSPIKRRPSAAV